MGPQISVITPCYNAESTIRETIDSVLRQTFKDWELLIIDDCSTDNSAEIIREYSSRDSRIKYFKTGGKSGSPSMPRNIGIDNASGEYIAFLDADDVWLPDKLTKQIDFMTDNNADLSYSYYEKMTWDGKRSGRIVRTRPLTTYEKLLRSNSIPCLTSMISRNAIGDTRFKQIAQEDFCFWLDVLKKGYKAHNICEVTAIYRETQNSRSSNKIDMFKGYWNVIRNHQHISTPKASVCMVTYAIMGTLKFLK